MGSINKIPGLPKNLVPFRILADTEFQTMPGGKLQIMPKDYEFSAPPAGAQVIRAIRRDLTGKRIIIYNDDTGETFNVSADKICEVH